MAFFLNGCAVFSPVGHVISQGYENTVSYFNGYYNAKRLFSDAEDEILTADLLARSKLVPASTANQVNQIPAAAKQKFGQVIDKCSNILAFHSTSTLVDDALLLIGKSFFYQMEYIKAERKFAELLAQYPNSPLELEAQLWYARTEEKLGKFDDGIRLSEATISAAHTNGDGEIETQAHQLLGLLYRRTKQIDKAVTEYEKVIALSTDDEIKGNAQISLGEIYFSDHQYAKSAEMYVQTRKYTSDIYSNYYSKLQASVAYREMKEYKKGLTLLDAMIGDFRNKEYLPALLFERANNYAASGRRDEAIGEYVNIDTTYKNTDYVAKSAYQLGLLYEQYVGNYSLALKYYTEVNSASGLDIVADGRRKFTALTRYFNAWQRLTVIDSLFVIVRDTTRKKFADTLITSVADTAQQKIVKSAVASSIANMDTIKAISDTAKFKAVAQPVLPSIDSLNVLRSIAARELGDVFYSEVVVPDSAFYWYNKSLGWHYDHNSNPRVLYILAELSRTNPENKFPLPEEYYTRLDHDFPESIYAEEARRLLGRPSSVKKKDAAAASYEEAEKQIDAKKYDKAIATLRNTARSFPQSPMAAKSEYAIGWIMENCLAQPESAVVQYKHVAEIYKGTTYALAATKRSLDTVQFVRATIDSSKDTVNQKSMKLMDAKKDTMKSDDRTLEQKPIPSPEEINSGRKRGPRQKPRGLDPGTGQ